MQIVGYFVNASMWMTGRIGWSDDGNACCR